MIETDALKSADQSSTSSSFADVTDLTFTIQANTTYYFRFVVQFNTGASDAIRLAVNGPSSPTSLRVGGVLPTSTTASDFGSQTAYDTAIFASTAAVGTARMAIVEGCLVNGSNAGTLALRFASEATGSVSVLKNSSGTLLVEVIDASSSDTASVTDSVGTDTSYVRLPSDTADLADQVVASTQYVRAASDTLSATDTVSASFEKAASAQDAVSVTDAISTSTAYGRAPSDTVTAGDLAETGMGYGRSVSDSIAVSDVITVVEYRVLSVALSDTVGVTDDLQTWIEYARGGVDTVAASDAVDAQLFVDAIPVNVSDEVNVTDVVATALSLSLSVSDSIATGDQVATETGYERRVDEAASITDALITWADYHRLAADSVSVDDDVGAVIVTPDIQVLIVEGALVVVDEVLVARRVTITTPPERTSLAKAEDRTLVIDREKRAVLVKAEDRTYKIQA